MTTIRAYTTIEQSRKLAEILPIESADMYYSHEFVNSAGDYYKLNIALEGHFNDEELLGSDIPCWSLAALFSALPAECECMALEHINYGNNHKEYFMHYAGGENTEDYDNPVDACYEMVINLHELNLL